MANTHSLEFPKNRSSETCPIRRQGTENTIFKEVGSAVGMAAAGFCPDSRQITRKDPTEGIQQPHFYGLPVMWIVIGTEETVTKDRISCESDVDLKLSQGGSDAG